jgi:hypothetical protein
MGVFLRRTLIAPHPNEASNLRNRQIPKIVIGIDRNCRYELNETEAHHLTSRTEGLFCRVSRLPTSVFIGVPRGVFVCKYACKRRDGNLAGERESKSAGCRAADGRRSSVAQEVQALLAEA